MIEENRSSILGPTGRMLVDTKPVGGRIPKHKYDEWLDFKEGCRNAGLQLSPDGMIDMIETYNRINKAVFPMARIYGFEKIEFKNAVIDIILQEIKSLNIAEWEKDSKKIKSKIKDKLNSAIKVSID